jgi:anaerobic sulfite reductase subunit C
MDDHAYTKSEGFIPLREPGLYTIRLAVVGGRVPGEWLAVLSGIASRFGRGHVHLTTRQNIEIPFIREADLPQVRGELEAAGILPGGCGARIRTVVACPGTICRHGLIDSQDLADRISRQLGARSLPHKFKIAITGCPNSCAKPIENDFGIQGAKFTTFDAGKCINCGQCLPACKSAGALRLDDGQLVRDDAACVNCGDCAAACSQGAFGVAYNGYVVFVGGQMGRRPSLGRKLPLAIRDEATLLRLLDACLDWYQANGQPRERFGRTLDRVGLDRLVAHLAPCASPDAN